MFCGVCVSVRFLTETSRLPSGPTPPARWNFSHAARSRAVAFIEPDGFGSAHLVRRHRLDLARPCPIRCPLARSASFGMSVVVKVTPVIPSGSQMRVRTSFSHFSPVRCSMARPAAMNRMLE